MAPRGVAHHDLARTVRITEVAQRCRKALACLGHAGLVDGAAIAQNQPVVLVGLQQLFAAAFAAHHEKAAVGHQFGGCDELPRTLEQFRVERLNQAPGLAHARAAPIEQRDEARDLPGLHAQCIQRVRLHDLHRDEVRMVRQETQQVELFEQPDDPLARHDDDAVDLMLDHQRERIEKRHPRCDGHQFERGQLAHRQRVERAAIDDRALQSGVGEDPEPGAIAHQQTAGPVPLHRGRHGDDARRAVDHMGRAQKGFVDPGHRQRVQFALAVALRQRAELFRQIGEQQGAECRVARDQRLDGGPGQFVRHHLFGRDEAAAGAAGHQRAAVEAVVGPERGHEFVGLELRDVALDDDEQVQRFGAGIEDRFRRAEIGDVDTVPDDLLLAGVQAVERRGREVERVGHGRMM